MPKSRMPKASTKLQELLSKHNAQYFVQFSGSDDANFYYATNFKISDPVFLAVGNENEDFMVVPEMERNRASRESKITKIFSLNDLGFAERLQNRAEDPKGSNKEKKVGKNSNSDEDNNEDENKDPKKALALTFIKALESQGAKKILIPPDFPSFLYYFFSQKFEIKISENPFARMREIKTKKEVEMIKETSIAIIESLKYLITLLKRGERNCDKLRDEIELFLFSKGFLGRHTIIASGTHTSDPHFIGEGRVEKHLIADIFPKSRKTGYYSDFTRTIILEKDTNITDMHDAVIEAKLKGISMIKSGVLASDIHNAVCDILEDKGYHTLRGKSREGFIHSTGHGVGLEVHEMPSIYTNGDILKSGMVLTIEPGLYYKKCGGVRSEDTVLVRKSGYEVLTKYDDRVDLYGK